MLFHAQTIDDLAAYLRQHYPAAIRRDYPDEPIPDAEGLAAGPASVNGHAGGDGSAAGIPLIPRVSRESEDEELLARLDDLSDEEVESLLSKENAQDEVTHE